MKTLKQKQFTLLFFLCFLAVNFLTFPARLARESGSDGLISLFASCVFAYMGTIAVVKVVACYPNLTYREILVKIFGKVLSKVVIFFYYLNIIYLAAYSIRLLSEEINIYLLRQMPILPIEVLFLFAAVLFASKKDKAFGNFAQMSYVFITAGLIFIIFNSATSANPENILPIFVSNYSDIFSGSAAMSSYLFSALLVFPVFAAKVENLDEKKAKRDFAIVTLVVFIIYAAYYVLCISVIGQKLCEKLIFPALCVVQSTKYENVFLQRYEVLLIAIVMSLYFLYSAVMLRGAAELSANSEKAKVKPRVYAVTAAVVIVVLFLNDRNIGSVVAEYIDLNNFTFPHNFLITVLVFGNSIKTWTAKRKGSSVCTNG